MRKGMATGQGKGYRNIVGRDSGVHRDSAQGIKQPQKINTFTNIPKHTEALKDYDEYLKKVKDKREEKPKQEITMAVYNKGESVNEQDFGVYDNYETAINDLINYDIPKGRYGVLDDGTKITSITQAKRLLKRYKD